MKVVSDKTKGCYRLGRRTVSFPEQAARFERCCFSGYGTGAKRVEDSVVDETRRRQANDVSFNELVDKLVALMEEGDASKFKKDNTPKAAIVNELAGRTLSSEQRNAAWEAALRS